MAVMILIDIDGEMKMIMPNCGRCGGKLLRAGVLKGRMKSYCLKCHQEYNHKVRTEYFLDRS